MCSLFLAFSFFKSCNCVSVFVTGVMDLVVGNSIWLTERQRENPSFVSLHKLWTTTILLVLLLVRPKFLYLSTNKAFNNHSSSFAQNRIICIASLPAREDDASVDLPPPRAHICTHIHQVFHHIFMFTHCIVYFDEPAIHCTNSHPVTHCICTFV